LTRPRSIHLFAVAFALLVLVNLIHGVIAADYLYAIAPEFARALGDAYVPFVLTLRVAFPAWLGWLIVRRASNFAKWTVVVLTIIKLRSIGDAWTGLQTANVNSILWSIGTALGLFAVGCLFAPASRSWFARKGVMESDAAVFE
jgi:hypothetical protein